MPIYKNNADATNKKIVRDVIVKGDAWWRMGVGGLCFGLRCLVSGAHKTLVMWDRREGLDCARRGGLAVSICHTFAQTEWDIKNVPDLRLVSLTTVISATGSVSAL